MPKQSYRFLEIALLIGLVVGAGTTYALLPLIDNMISTTTSTQASSSSYTTTVFSTTTSTEDSIVTVPQTIVSTTTSTADASTSTKTSTATSTKTQTTTLTSTTTETTTETATVTSRTTTSSKTGTDISYVTIPLGSSTVSSLGFQPPTIVVVIGVNNTVQWVNLDNATHSIIFLSFKIPGQSQLDPGRTFSVTFTEVGTASYVDIFYPWMRGIVIVKG